MRCDYLLSQLAVLEAESIHIIREVAAEFERPVLLFSGGKDSIVMLRLAEKAFWPAPVPFPVMHVDTGHNFPEVIEYRDRRVAELGVRLVIASVQESIDKGRVVEETGPRASRNRLQTTTLLDAIEEHAFDAAIGGARTAHPPPPRPPPPPPPPRRGAQPRKGADLLLPRRLRPVEPARAAARAVEPLQRARPQGRARPRLPDLELDRARRLAVRGARAARAAADLLRARARGVPPRRDAVRGLRVHRAHGGRGAVRHLGPLPHRRRHDVHRRRRVDGVDDRGGGRGDRGDARHRARRDPRRRPFQRGGHGGPQTRWLLLSKPSRPSFSGSSRAARSTTASRR